MTLKLLHRVWGVVVVLVFLGTGQYMLHRHPAMKELAADSRMLYRSAHIYLVMSGLLNLGIGSYLVPHRLKWLQWAGSIFLFAAPVLIFAGFCTESIQTGIDRPLTSSGVYLAFAGALLHFISSFSFRSQ